jgi:hypothetical protein
MWITPGDMDYASGMTNKLPRKSIQWNVSLDDFARPTP